jgi:hypothetical protein
MATRVFEADFDEASFENEAGEPHGGIVRGLFFAMLFNVFLACTVAAAWELWRLMR